jgi:pimeloyl-ACP methyl ester carboxylesterase
MYDSVRNLAGAAALATALTTAPFAAAAADSYQIHYENIVIDGVEIAYREAGDPARPTVLLLHGFPTSSQMFRNLIPELAARYHVLAPDYPGFGASAMPLVNDFDYSFGHFAELMTAFIDAKGVGRYAAYVMDYGAPVGYRMFAADPERVIAFVIQNGNAYEEGLEEVWDPIRAYWAEPSAANGDTLRGFLTLDATEWQYLNGAKNPSKISPDNFWNVQYLLDRPGNQDIQLALFYDYRTNVALYPQWQALFRQYQPPALIVWGKNDAIFPASGAEPYKRDLKDLEFNLLDTGHFALEEEGPFIAQRMLAFLDRVAP